MKKCLRLALDEVAAATLLSTRSMCDLQWHFSLVHFFSFSFEIIAQRCAAILFIILCVLYVCVYDTQLCEDGVNDKQRSSIAAHVVATAIAPMTLTSVAFPTCS